ncbi:MAG TPA: hypothetical protein VHO25_09255, partial [Polyangiaceae bacterium]|nr:hypothetical protein [Polyangiaceae bacterium]
MKLRAIQVVTGLMAVGCWDPGLPSTGQAEPAAASAQARFLTVEPAASDGVRPLSRFGFELPAGGALESLRLYQGALSDYHQRRISKGELPNTLLEREVPVIRWAANTADAGSVQRVMSQAQVPLDPGESYTWAWLGQGPLLSFAVGDEQPMGWRRLWPTVDAGFWGYAAYCQESSGVVRDAGSGVLQPAAGASALNWVFEPGAHPATARQGLGLLDIAQDACLHFEIDSDPLPELLVPPLVIAGSTLDPAPLRAQRSDPVQPLRCEDDWRPMGPGCIQVQDDRLAIASPSSPTLWLLGSSDLQFYGVQQGPFVVRGLAPGHEHIFEFTTHSVDGRRHQGRMALT